MKNRFKLIYKDNKKIKKQWQNTYHLKEIKRLREIEANTLKEAIEKTKNLKIKKLYYYDELEKKFYDLKGEEIDIC